MGENERTYRTMSLAGASDIVVGILWILIGISMGVLAIVNGGRLLRARKNLML